METTSTPVTPTKKEDSPESPSLSSYLVGLNEQQLAAATAPVEGATRILGSAGERSVEVLVARVTHLVRHHGLEPSQIVILTFSKDATAGILARLEDNSNLGWDEAQQVVIGTFHQICKRFLEGHGHHVGLSYFQLQDSNKTSLRIARLPQYRLTSRINLNVPKIIKTISYAKNKGLSPDKLKEDRLLRLNPSEREAVAKIWSAYEEQLELENVLDFDNLLIKGAELFALPVFAGSFASVLVDSFHNTTALQYRVVHALASHSQSITVVGSPDLSIFSWTSANDGQFNKLIEDFTPHQTVQLEQNYTTSRSILEVANELMKQDSSRINKTLSSRLPRGPPVVLHHALDEQEEAEFFARTIISLRGRLEGLVDYKDFAVLVSQNWMLGPVKNALTAAGIPFSSEVEAEKVVVSTIHSTAGLSRAIVFVPGVEQGIFPHSSTKNYNEERRILFVAVTCARTHCILSYAKTRESSSGRRSSKSLSPFIIKNRFVSELPMIAEYMRREVAGILGKEWPPRSDEEEEKKVVPTLSPLRPEAIPTTPKRERNSDAPTTPPCKRIKREVEESPTSR